MTKIECFNQEHKLLTDLREMFRSNRFKTEKEFDYPKNKHVKKFVLELINIAPRHLLKAAIEYQEIVVKEAAETAEEEATQVLNSLDQTGNFDD